MENNEYEVLQVQHDQNIVQLDAVERANVDSQVATAKQYPRNVTRSINNSIAMATMDVNTAQSCGYALPRGGKPITGPSVHLAKLIVSNWGNIRAEAKVVQITDKQVISRGTCWDLENNVATAFEVRRSIVGRTGQRFSDDMLYIGSDYVKAMHILTEELGKMQMKLNPKKVEYLDAQHWFKFLGYSIKGSSISLSSTRIKTFQKEIESRSCCRRGATLTTSVNMINRFLYKGYDGHSWATQVLPVINVKEDIDTLTTFIIDALRATVTGKRRIGGLGYVKHQSVGCIARGRGKNVTTNRHKTPERIPGFPSLGLMRNALLTSRAAYDTLVANL